MDRAKNLLSRFAIPAYALIAWGWIGNISRDEYVFRKVEQFEQLPYARLSLIVVGFAWLGWLVTRKSPDGRVNQMRQLLLEAQRDFETRKTEVTKDFSEMAKQSWPILSIQNFSRTRLPAPRAVGLPAVPGAREEGVERRRRRLGP